MKSPIVEVIKTDWRNIVKGIGLRIAETAGYAVSITYMISYLNSQHLADKTQTLVALCIASAIGIFATQAWARLTDRIGRRPLYIWSCAFALLFAIPMFLLVNTGMAIFIIATLVISYAVCQNSLAGSQGAWFPELFQAKTRASGASLSYQISAMVSGFTPSSPRCCSSASAGWARHCSLACTQPLASGPQSPPAKPGASASASWRTRPRRTPPSR